LLDLLPFDSCLGVPIQVQDETHHAAFFFHREPDAFSQLRFLGARISALLFAALLEEDVVNQRLRSLNPMLLSGQLAAGFGHEMFNKISGLEIQLRNLLTIHGSLDEVQVAVARALDLTLDLKRTGEVFQQLMRAKEDRTVFDVNEVIQRAEMLVRPEARKERVKTVMKLAVDSLPVAGNSTTLQQVFLNVILNAVQQMGLKQGGPRVLEIRTGYREGQLPIQVRFADTGPGIHKQLWEKIFAPGFSTRGGTGLGLYIARSFVQSLGGRIRVEESFIPMGTTFLVELPRAKQEKI
jgi:signal transduction histidine kinase